MADTRADQLEVGDIYQEYGDFEDEWRKITALDRHGDTLLVTYDAVDENGELTDVPAETGFKTTHDTDEVVDVLQMCKECGDRPAEEWGMCGSCIHDAQRSGWNPPSD